MLNFAQWSLANLDGYTSNTARNLSILRDLSLTGMANALHAIMVSGDLTFDAPWVEAEIKGTYEGKRLAAITDDTEWNECVQEVQKLRGADGHGPLTALAAADATDTPEKLDGRPEPITAAAIVAAQASGP